MSRSCMPGTHKDEFRSISNSHFDDCDGRHCFKIRSVYRTLTATCTEASMLLLALIARLLPVPAEQPDQGALPLHPAIGHLGLTIIALVYVLVVMWRG